MCTYSADISVLHLPLPVFKSCIFIRRHERDLARNHSPDLFFIDRLFLSHFPDTITSLTIYSRRNKTNFLQHAWSSPLHFHPSIWTRNFLLNLIFNLICSVVSFRDILPFSSLFFFSIPLTSCENYWQENNNWKVQRVKWNRVKSTKYSAVYNVFFPTLSVRAIYFRGTRDRCLKTSRILWSWRWII